MRKSKRADIPALEKRSDDIPARDRHIQARRMRLVVVRSHSSLQSHDCQQFSERLGMLDRCDKEDVWSGGVLEQWIETQYSNTPISLTREFFSAACQEKPWFDIGLDRRIRWKHSGRLAELSIP